MDTELCVVGAGPCGLALLLRLARAASQGLGTSSTEKAQQSARRLLSKCVIIDASGGWLALWRRKLASQGVEHLRSPTFVHPHASRLIDDALGRFARIHNRRHQLKLIEGSPLSARSATGTTQWHAPSAQLFDDFCAKALAALEAFDPTLSQRLLVARVVDIDPLAENGFELRLEPSTVAADRGANSLEAPRSLRAARVVLALGDGAARARWPRWAQEALRCDAPSARIRHAAEMAQMHPAVAMASSARASLAVRAAQSEQACSSKVLSSGVPASVSGLLPLLLLLTWAQQLLQTVTSARRFLWTGTRTSFRDILRRAWQGVRRGDPRALLRQNTEEPLACNPLAAPVGRGRLLVVGCGLSGAQLACEALRRGWSRVTILCRASAVVRPFDIDEVWVSRHLSCEMQPCEAEFFRAGFAERLALLRRARPGGSLTPALARRLRELEADCTGRLRLRERSEVVSAQWRWHGTAEADAQGGGEWLVRLQDAGARAGSTCIGNQQPAGSCVTVDSIWLATGHSLDVADAAPLASLRRQRPQPAEHGGLPELTPSLRWDEVTKVYVAGALSALQLGPDALNLAGCALSAARIVSDLCSDEDVLADVLAS